MTVAELPAPIEPYAWLIGTWRGDGVGGYPTLDADFAYTEELTFGCPEKPLLTFASRSWSTDDGRPLALQSGFLRPVSDTDVEMVVAVAAGLVEIFYGSLVTGPSGVHLELETDLVARTSSAKDVTRERRMYAVRGGRLMYAADMAAAGETELRPHLSAALDRVD